MRRIAWGVVAALLLVGVHSWFGPDPDADVTKEPDGVEEVAFSSRAWVEALRDGAELQFVREAAPGSRELIGTVQSLGPVNEDLVEDLVSRLGVAASAKALAAAATRAESGNPEDFVAFLKERYCYEKVLRAVDKVRRGDYVTLPSTLRQPPVPDGWVLLGQFRASLVGKEAVDVWFLFDLSLDEYQTLRQMKADWEEAEALLVDEDVRNFNFQPFEERKRQIERHLAAMKELQNTALHAVPAEEQRRLRARLLPDKFVVDARNFIVSRRIQHRY